MQPFGNGSHRLLVNLRVYDSASALFLFMGFVLDNYGVFMFIALLGGAWIMFGE